MADTHIIFYDANHQPIPLRAKDNGDGTYSLAVAGSPGVSNKTVVFYDERNQPVGIAAKDNGDGSYSLVVAGGGITSQATPPPGAQDGDLWLCSLNNKLYFYKASVARWLTLQTYTTAGMHQSTQTGSPTNMQYFDRGSDGDIYAVSLQGDTYVGGVNDANNYWTYSVQVLLDDNQLHQQPYSATSAGFTHDVYREVVIPINALFTPTQADRFYLHVDKTGGPGQMYTETAWNFHYKEAY